MKDKKIEQKRYDNRAKKSLKDNDFFNINNLSEPLKTPYLHYQEIVKNYMHNSDYVLEIGAGQGENTEILLNKDVKVIATDISVKSLKVIEKRFANKNLSTKVADIENLPFADNYFDIVVSAGSLSYGDNKLVLNEIYRVLKKDGIFIAIDSLNNNPIYRINRYFHYLRGDRSKSVIKRIPNIKLLEKYKAKFGKIKVNYFGSISYLIPIIVKLFGEKRAKIISDRVDNIFSAKKSAFKFVMVAQKDK